MRMVPSFEASFDLDSHYDPYRETYRHRLVGNRNSGHLPLWVRDRVEERMPNSGRNRQHAAPSPSISHVVVGPSAAAALAYWCSVARRPVGALDRRQVRVVVTVVVASRWGVVTRYSAWLPSPSGPPFEGGDDVLKRLGKGGQVTVIHSPAVHLGDELDQCRGPRRALGGRGDGHFLNDGDKPVDLDNPVDDLDGGAPGRGGAGEFPGPVTARGRAPLRQPTSRRDEDR